MQKIALNKFLRLFLRSEKLNSLVVLSIFLWLIVLLDFLYIDYDLIILSLIANIVLIFQINHSISSDLNSDFLEYFHLNNLSTNKYIFYKVLSIFITSIVLFFLIILTKANFYIAIGSIVLLINSLLSSAIIKVKFKHNAFELLLISLVLQTGIVILLAHCFEQQNMQNFINLVLSIFLYLSLLWGLLKINSV